MENKHKIWQIIYQIPSGKVASYGQVAALAGLPGYARYVGHVLKALPTDSKLPWHRVANAQGKLSFPLDSKQYHSQKNRLEAEGIVFIRGKISLKIYGWKL
ncbi:MAG: cysteine methyltransferase [SAR86 cluster bacterium]|uniref:Cysteine methyltransferase n=1 Tax=SAR86 cluster bacterium TaxID=2030880 RepID=A0A2A4MFX6_9GAMM|nr:MAG: cysteine methyltransferase [SAR86 cluster bacterium]